MTTPGSRPPSSNISPFGLVADSNSTANHFLGATQRPWMNTNFTGPPATTHPRSVTAPTLRTTVPVVRSHDIRRIAPGIPLSLSPHVEQNADVQYAQSAQPPLALSQKSPVDLASAVLPSPAPSDDGAGVLTAQRYQEVQRPNHSTAIITQQVDSNQSRNVPRQMPAVAAAPTQIFVPNSQPFVLQPTPWPSQIKSFIQANGGAEILRDRNNIVLTRVHLLEEACNPDLLDLAFLAMHQLSCMAAVNILSLPKEVLECQHLQGGLKVLHNLLAESKVSGYGFQEFFANFPARLNHLRATYPAYVTAILQATDTFTFLATRYIHFEEHFVHQPLPPTIEHMVNDLHVTSPTLQRILCNAIVRKRFHAVRRQDMLLSAVEKCFRDYQQEHVQHVILYPSTGLLHKLTDASAAVSNKHLSKFSEIYRVFADPNAYTQLARPSPQVVAPAPTQPTRQTVALPQSRQSSFSGQALTSSAHNTINSSRIRTAFMPNIASGRQLQPVTHLAPAIPAVGHFVQTLPSPTQFVSPPQITQPGIARSAAPSSFLVDPRKKPFFHRPEVPVSQVVPAEPQRLALHEAILRGRTLRLQAQLNEAAFYQFIERLPLPPQAFAHNTKIQQWTFQISKKESSLLPEDIINPEDGQPMRLVSDTTKTFRLRCAKVHSNTTPGEWVVAETKWPDHVYWTFNGHSLLPQRKLLNGKDLAIDVTGFIVAGENKVKAFSNRRENDPELGCAVAVEMVAIQAFDDIVGACKRRVIPETVAKSQLSAALRRHSTNTTMEVSNNAHDDDLVITNSSLTINLLDPFIGSRIWDTPVRGKSCMHYDCFDLVTFLETRKNHSDGKAPSAVDIWKCPICEHDARPTELVVDGWLMGVKEELAKRGQLEIARAIIVRDNGEWTVAEETGGGRRSGGDVVSGGRSSTPGRERNVIELE